MTIAQVAPALEFDAADSVVGFRDAAKIVQDGTRALADVPLTVRAGEFASVVVPAGCGESTLLRLASGLETPTAGAVRIGASGR